MEVTAAVDTPLQPLDLSSGISAEFCLQLERSLHKTTWAGVAATQQVLTPQVLQSIVMGVAPILEKEPTLIEVSACCYSAGWPTTAMHTKLTSVWCCTADSTGGTAAASDSGGRYTRAVP